MGFGQKWYTPQDWAEQYQRMVDSTKLYLTPSHALVDGDRRLVELFAEAMSYARDNALRSVPSSEKSPEE